MHTQMKLPIKIRPFHLGEEVFPDVGSKMEATSKVRGVGEILPKRPIEACSPIRGNAAYIRPYTIAYSEVNTEVDARADTIVDSTVDTKVDRRIHTEVDTKADT
jgi:hypothetical protein